MDAGFVSATDLKQAYRTCERLAAAHYENFPVASRLLPAAMRPHVAAVYAFARVADDFADEGTCSESERHRALDNWVERLHACAAGSSLETAGNQNSRVDTQIFLAVGETIRRCHLPVALFEDLVSAFRQDVTVRRYDTWDRLMDYCRRSANPVGRLALRIAGYRQQSLDEGSDALCTALQLTNFWQDLERDWQRGRLYVPVEEYRRCGAHEADLNSRRITEAWRAALKSAARRTRSLYEQGRRVCDGVNGRLGLELRLTWTGGMRILTRLERAGFDVFTRRPTLGIADVPPLMWGAVTWRKKPDATMGSSPT